uniref:Uncharacterized protein n=1 Tax=Melopsittacus undulatus TaxID=13146 RepID=A0A8V5H8Q2_MELUD
RGPAPPPNLTSNRRLQQTQAQVDEVVDIMRVNVDKVLERDQKLSSWMTARTLSRPEPPSSRPVRPNDDHPGVICAIVLIIIIGEICK